MIILSFQLLITKNIRFYVSETKLQFEIGNNRLKSIKSDSFEILVDICIVGIGLFFFGRKYFKFHIQLIFI